MARKKINTSDSDDDETSLFDRRFSDIPVDKYHFVYLVMILQGIGVLFPWNAFISAPDYFEELYPRADAEFYFGFVYNWPNMIILLLLIKFGAKFTFTSRILFGLGVDFVCLIAVPIVGNVVHAPWTLYFTYTCVGLTGLATGILFGSLTGFASFFPQHYIQAIMAGNGVAGVIIALMRVVTKIGLPETAQGTRTATLIYFACAGLVVLLCFIGYLLVLRRPYTHHYMPRQYSARSIFRPEIPNNSTPITPRPPPAEFDEDTHVMVVSTSSTLAEDHSEVERLLPAKSASAAEELSSSDYVEEDDNDETEEQAAQPQLSRWKVIRKVMPMGINVAITFFITLALFPGVLTLIPPTHGPNTWVAWFQIILVSIFQVGDFIGRSLPRWFNWLNYKTIWIPCLIRFIFFPLFILCITPRVFENEAWPCVFCALFAISNGYVSTRGMMLGTSYENLQDNERETAGVAMTSFLNLGILCGVTFALMFPHVLPHLVVT